MHLTTRTCLFFQLLDSYNFVNYESNREFLMSTQAQTVGGFSKWPDGHPGILHICS